MKNVNLDKRKTSPPKVNVVVTTYNHERYISQCLENILKQKGDFTLEIILSDDGSLDNTQRILLDYAQQHPGKIILKLAKNNQGMTKNLKQCLDLCSGDYTAFCEGDDYWTDCYKIQKQIEFLHDHPDFSMCFSAIVLYYENEEKYLPHPDQLEIGNNELSVEALIENNYIGNFSCCMYRTDIVKRLPEELFEIDFADWIFNVSCGRLGKIGFLRDWMSVYRIHPNGTWSKKSALERQRYVLNCIETYDRFLSYQYSPHFEKIRIKTNNEIDSILHKRPLIIRIIKNPINSLLKFNKILKNL